MHFQDKLPHFFSVKRYILGTKGLIKGILNIIKNDKVILLLLYQIFNKTNKGKHKLINNFNIGIILECFNNLKFKILAGNNVTTKNRNICFKIKLNLNSFTAVL